MAKQIAPPKVTGGGGFVFEDKVAAYFLACLLSGRPPLDPSLGLLSRVDFQTRVDGWFLDDLLLTLIFGEDTRRCAFSVKSNQQFTVDAAPHEFVTLAWEQFLREGTTHFRSNRDLLGLVVTLLPQELAKALYELLSWAQMQASGSLPDRLTAPGFASELKRHLFRSFACPEELATKHGIRDTNIGELLRCIRILSFDFEHDPSTRLQLAVQYCRSVLRSGALEEAVSLWERLLATASEHRPRAGYLDLPRLLEQVRSSFQLKDYPNYQADWAHLLARTRENLTIIPDKIGNTVFLSREPELAALETAYSETRFVVLLGPSGCGKTVTAKLFAEGKLQAHKVLWWNAGSFDVRDFATFEAALNLHYPLQELLETVPDSLAYTVIDGLDRVSGAAFQNLSVFLQGLRPNAATSPWRVLITCQPEEWERIRTELVRVNAPLAKWREVEVTEPNAEDLSPVWNAFPTLQHLALRPNLQTLLLKPKVLDLLAFKLSTGGAVDTREWVGESDLIQWFWDTEITKSPHGAMRSLFLMSLGEKQADDLHTETPLDTFALADLTPLDGLRQDHICKQHEERLSFSHDLYGDWARQRKLLQQADLRSYLESHLASPLWHRAVRLYGLHLLEQEWDLTRWRAAMKALAAENTEGNLAQDLLLESVIFAAQPLILLERLWPDLAANGGLLLCRLLGRFLHVATLPNPVIKAVTKAISPDLETEAATLYRLPYWPYWLPMLQFLYNHQAEVMQLASQHVAEITGTWLQRGHESWVLRREAAELALALAELILHLRQSGGFVYIEAKLVKSAYRAALAAVRELPGRVVAFVLEACARREPPPQESPNEMDAGGHSRQTLLATDIGVSPISEDYAVPWPDGPHGRVDADFRDICLQENMLLSLIMTAPSIAREVLLALLIEPPRDNDPLWPNSRLDDNLEVEYMFGWYPPFYMRGPFLLFLHLHPAEGLEVILRLVNFATERWAARWVGAEPPGVTIPLPDNEARWIGSYALYYWYRAYSHCPHPVAVALMALEKWLYDAIDAQQPIHETLNILLQRSRSIAFAGLLSAIARKEPSLFEGILQPLLAIPELHYWELRYNSKLDQVMFPMTGWEDQGTLFIKLACDWHTLPHRRKGLHEWARYLFLNVSQMRPFFERARLQWIARLQAVEEGNEFEDYLEKFIAQYDIKNYEVQSHPERGEMRVFTPPEALRLKSEKFQKDIEEERLLLDFPLRCRQTLDTGQPLPHDSLEQFWDLLQHISQFTPPTNDDSEGSRIEDAVCGGVAVLLKFHRQWLHQYPARAEWCIQQLLTTIRNPPKAGRQYHETAHMTRKWEQFCAQVLPLLWAEVPDSSTIRECIALLATCHYYKTVEILFTAIAEHRHHLGAHFKQLQHFLLRWAAARWKWQRFLYKEETRLELEEWRHRAIQAFVTQSITAEVPHWEEIVVQTQSRQVRPPEYIKGRRGIKKIRSQQDPGLDIRLIQAAYSWLPTLDQAANESERMEWIAFWNEALDCLLRMLGTDTEDEEEIPGTPYGEDSWVLRCIAGLIMQLHHSERSEDFWKPILSLGTPGHLWVKTFLSKWFTYGLHTEPTPEAFVREWRAMLEFAFASPKWNFDSVKRWFKLEELWCALMGFDGISRDVWTVSQKPVVKHMYGLYERWADMHLQRPRCARAFIAFLTQPTAEDILLDGLTWLEKGARQAGDWFWSEHGSQEALVSLLDVCWRSYQGRLRQHEAAFSAFKMLLKKLADFQNPIALEIQQRVVSAHDWPT